MQVLDALLQSDAWRAVKYRSRKEVFRATRILCRGKIRRGKNVPVEVVLHLGRPNYREREFIKKYAKAGGRFPVKKIQLQFPPKT